MVMRNIHPKPDLHCIHSLLNLVRIEGAVNLLSVLHVAVELLPSRPVDELIIMYILGKVYWFIATHH